MATVRLLTMLPLWWSLCVSSALTPVRLRTLPLWWSLYISNALTPQALLAEWQAARIKSLDVDASRYHAQVLFVDDDNARARMAESCADALAHWADAGWWIYPHSCSLTEDQALIENPRQEAILTSLGFDGTRVTAAGAALAKEDLDAYDLVICADAAVRDAVLALGEESYETSVRLLADFATVADARSRALFDGLDVALAERARSRQDGGELVVEGADAQSDRDGFDALLESTLVLTAALVVFLKDSFDASFTDSFNGLLRTHFYDERHVDARWADAEPALRRHIVTGALDPRERERLFDAHMTGLRQRLSGDGVSS
ncbi:unnamed protein product [Pelagomonas calceolata]|uniref:Uncharacterized protein n=1 Tax=Pelagomonas calceolata TaxID=35677 RepID=A0A7S4A4B1_9STRA|nr:unnamed protein product [Pelagomonas calceolata]|mmetsp:Transcript_3439/g.10206  ORF Transcript_3439/g.10206 Transcript_3439/m.10206 type:complete len:318 (-) Transcript_3439:39-992(-)